MPEPMQPITNPALVDAMATFKVDLANRDNEENFREHEKAFLKAAIEADKLDFSRQELQAQSLNKAREAAVEAPRRAERDA